MVYRILKVGNVIENGIRIANLFLDDKISHSKYKRLNKEY